MRVIFPGTLACALAASVASIAMAAPRAKSAANPASALATKPAGKPAPLPAPTAKPGSRTGARPTSSAVTSMEASPRALARPAIPFTPGPPLALDVRRARLDNGLRVVISVDHTAPTVAVDVVYDVGSRVEERGRSGFAHLFEHMLFQGSPNVGPGEMFKLVTARGGNMDATTTTDTTSFYATLPASELALALWLEADRMKAIDVSQASFNRQRAVVHEERRAREENVAYEQARRRLTELIFQGYWPYEHPIGGTAQDLDAAQVDTLRAFHRAHYVPSNAVLVIVGDVEPDEALTLAAKYFGNVPSPPEGSPAKFEAAKLPEPTAPREDVVVDAHLSLPALLLGWAIPPARDPDHRALELAAQLLAAGPDSRLYRELVRERGLATDVEMDTPRRRGPDSLELTVPLSEKAAVAQVDKVIDQELATLARTEPSPAEMARLRNRVRARFLFGIESRLARARLLADLELGAGDAALVNGELDRYLTVTAADIKRVAGAYLTKARRARVDVKPAAKGAK